jgi:hypothetical protein
MIDNRPTPGKRANRTSGIDPKPLVGNATYQELPSHKGRCRLPICMGSPAILQRALQCSTKAPILCSGISLGIVPRPPESGRIENLGLARLAFQLTLPHAVLLGTFEQCLSVLFAISACCNIIPSHQSQSNFVDSQPCFLVQLVSFREGVLTCS